MRSAHRAVGATGVLHEYRYVDRLMLMKVPVGRVETVIAAYRRNPNVLYAEPDYRVHATELPNDPAFPLQWGLRNIGQYVLGVPGTPGADVGAVEAWNIAIGLPSIQIAIIDTGVDYTHADLTDNMRGRPLELPGNHLDDDHNGWIDDTYGYDFANGDSDPMDDNSHGTHVAGILGAHTDNGFGVAGVAWKCQIVALKFLDSEGFGDTSLAADAMEYVIDNGIPISNNSWGGEGYSQTMRDVLAVADAHGHLFIAAAGNESSNNDVIDHYPSNYDLPNIIAVAATNNLDQPASFTNFGATTVDLGAPGVAIYSTIPGDSFGYKGGTSMATPFVSGAAALLMSHAPALTSHEVRDRILDTVRPAPLLVGLTATGGILNLPAALGDCNGNGILDDVDIANGTSEDCGGNGTPDECEDDCDLNGTVDSCDIFHGTYADCDANGVPDVCQPDCDDNGTIDACDLLAGKAEDCNTNAVPDRCEGDFDGDGTIDGCDDDRDNDGVPNAFDDCDFTPLGTPVLGNGAPIGDFDQDCNLSNADYFALFECLFFGGPDVEMYDRLCRTIFDYDGSRTLDLRDFAFMQNGFVHP